MTLTVRVTPNAKAGKIQGAETRDDGTCVLRIRVAAVPDKGRANRAAIKLLAKTLNLPPSAVSITSGATSRLKILTISGNTATLAAALDALA